MINIQNNILQYLDWENDTEEKFQKINSLFRSNDFEKNTYELKSILYFISNISRNHHREQYFFEKIEKIFLLLKDSIKKNLTNDQIFHIFRKNEPILLFFIKEKILILDKSIAEKINSMKEKYIKFFSPEINEFINSEKSFSKLPEHFYENRQKGENDDIVSDLIRKDMIDEFITYVNRNDYSLNSKIMPSTYETNPFLYNKKISLIKYAAFFGSGQIFTYLIKNGVNCSSSLFKYAIYGDNPEIINTLEEKKVEINCFDCIKHAIKCHHNDIVNYIQNNYVKLNLDEKTDNKIIIENALAYYNFSFLPDEFDDQYFFNFAVKFDYFILVKHFISTQNIDLVNINEDDSPFQLAAKINSTEIIGLLLSQIICIRDSCFRDCDKLTEISIPYSVNIIGNHAFEGCQSLIKITIPTSVISIGSYAFSECSSLEKILIPSSVTEIGSAAFNECFSLLHISIPSSVDIFGDDIFNGIKFLEIEGTMTHIPNNLFRNNKTIEELRISTPIETIGENSFERCTLLTQIILPSSLVRIGDNAFENCNSLNEIILPNSVEQIGKYAFSKCKSLIKIKIPSSLFLIGQGAFSECSSLIEIIIPSYLIYIEKRTFEKCISLKKVHIPPSVIEIRDKAFMDCKSLKLISIPSKMTKIGKYAFNGCLALSEITIPSSITEIGDYAFYGCLCLSDITIPSSKTKIGVNAFK